MLPHGGSDGATDVALDKNSLAPLLPVDYRATVSLFEHENHWPANGESSHTRFELVPFLSPLMMKSSPPAACALQNTLLTHATIPAWRIHIGTINVLERERLASLVPGAAWAAPKQSQSLVTLESSERPVIVTTQPSPSPPLQLDLFQTTKATLEEAQ